MSGGGVRGVFQATFLSCLEKHLHGPFSKRVDLVVGTSTGSLVGLAVALGVPTEKIVRLYKEKAELIFGGRLFSKFRKGPQYSQSELKGILTDLYGRKSLKDAQTPIVIAAAALNHFGHRLFSNVHEIDNSDRDLLIQEVALASCAAPTYFAPITPSGAEASYVDGGVWANSPALLSLLIAHYQLGIPLHAIRLLSIGTGHYPDGISAPEYERLRPLEAIPTLFNLIWDSQCSFSERYAEAMLPKGQYVRVDAQLPRAVELDDVRGSLDLLPALAEHEAQRLAVQIESLFPSDVQGTLHHLPPSLINSMLPAAGMTAFYPSREFYSKFRVDASSVERYVDGAQHSLIMVSINLMTGIPFHGLCERLKQKLIQVADPPFMATISVAGSL